MSAAPQGGGSRPALTSRSAAGDVHSLPPPPLPPHNHTPPPTTRACLPCVRGRPPSPSPAAGQNGHSERHGSTRIQRRERGGGGGGREGGRGERESGGGEGGRGKPHWRQKAAGNDRLPSLCREEGAGVHSWSLVARFLGLGRRRNQQRRAAHGHNGATPSPPFLPSTRPTRRLQAGALWRRCAARAGIINSASPPPTAPPRPVRRGGMSTDRLHQRRCGVAPYAGWGHDLSRRPKQT